MKKYRIKKIGDLSWWVIQKRTRFLWFSWWTTKWDEEGDNTFPLYFDRLAEAEEKLQELEDNE